MIIFFIFGIQPTKYHNMKTFSKLANAKLLDKKGLRQITGGKICVCGRPCPDPNQPPPRECD
ncbi:bacteriocin leader domain-containing protein [Elizabethkingia anophelis]|nr:bacteriocin leader domain-containing protein [Elizabethkingia anophelis]